MLTASIKGKNGQWKITILKESKKKGIIYTEVDFATVDKIIFDNKALVQFIAPRLK